MSIPSELLAVEYCCNVLNVKFLKIAKPMVFYLGLWCHRSSGSCSGHCSGEAAGRIGFQFPRLASVQYSQMDTDHVYIPIQVRGARWWVWTGASWNSPGSQNICWQWHCHSRYWHTACRPGYRKWLSKSRMVSSLSTRVTGLPLVGLALLRHLRQT